MMTPMQASKGKSASHRIGRRPGSGTDAGDRHHAAKTALARQLSAEIVKDLDRRPVGEIEILARDIPRLRQRIRDAIAPPGAEDAETLAGEGLRPVGGAEQRRERDAALSRAQRRGAATIADILSGPEMLTGRKFAERANVSHETVNRWRTDRRVLALSGNTRALRYPSWQLDESGRILGGLPAVLRAARDPWAAYRWLTTPLPQFDGETGLALVKSGRAEELGEAVRQFGTTF